ncbi:ribosomal protein L15 [Treponema pallidum subsp. pallidum]|nr:ribosomal protein L15 [Treponema pallidum subsp. pallidum]
MQESWHVSVGRHSWICGGRHDKEGAYNAGEEYDRSEGAGASDGSVFGFEEVAFNGGERRESCRLGDGASCFAPGAGGGVRLVADFHLIAPKGANRARRIVGRGSSSGRGTTSGRGTKGQQARAGHKAYVGFEGGQMPLYRRVPRRGFSNCAFKKEYAVVNVGALEFVYAPGETVNRQTLIEKGLVKGRVPFIKILADGELTKSIVVRVDRVSARAQEKIQQAGGSVECIEAQER